MKKQDLDIFDQKLEIQKEWCHIVINFLIDNIGETAGLKGYKDKIDESYSKKMLNNFNSHMVTIMGFIDLFPRKELQILESLLMNKLGIGLATKHQNIREKPLPFNKKNLKDSQREKLEFEKIWCDTILDFLIEHSTQNFVFRRKKERIDESYQKNRLGDFKYYTRDLMEFVNTGISEPGQRILDSLLIEKFGVGIKSLQKANKRKIQSIIKKEKITNEDEYRLVLDYIDQIYADSSKEAELRKLNALLNEFDDDLKNK